MTLDAEYTIIIITKNRHFLLSHIIEHYKTLLASDVIIVDASLTPFQSSLPASVTYLHTPNLEFPTMIHRALAQTKTSFTALIPDDDLVLPGAIEKLITKMKKDEYHIGVGKSLYYNYTFRNLTEARFSYQPFPNSGTLFQKLTYLSSSAMNLLWGVFTTETLRDLINVFISLKLHNLMLLEPILWYMVTKDKKLYIDKEIFSIKSSLPLNKSFETPTDSLAVTKTSQKTFEEIDRLNQYLDQRLFEKVIHLYRYRITAQKIITTLTLNFFQYTRNYLDLHNTMLTTLLRKLDRIFYPQDYLQSSTKESIIIIIDHARIPIQYDVFSALSEKFHLIFVMRIFKINNNTLSSIYPFNTLYALPNTDIIDLPNRLSPSFSNFKNKIYNMSFFDYKILLKLFMLTKLCSLGQWLFEKDLTKTILYQKDFFTKLIQNHNVRKTICITDKNISFHQPGLWLAAKEANIPIIIPHLFYHGPYISEISTNVKYKIWLFASLYQRIIFSKLSRLYPLQAYKGFYFYQAYVLNTLFKLGILSSNPWIVGTGPATHVLCDNKHTANRYIRWGTPPDKLYIVGDSSFDPLYECYQNRQSLKESLYVKYSLSPDKKLIILAVPQLYEHGLLDFDTHHQEIDFLLSTVSQSNYNLLLSLHPKMCVQDYISYSEKYLCSISEEPLKDIMACADLFMATFSNTVTWAAMLEIPSIVVDFYGFNYDIYDFLKSVKIINQKDALLPAVNSVESSEIDFSDDIQVLSKSTVFDGNTVNRTVKLIQKFT